MNRREMLASASLLAVAAAGSALAGENEPAHQHHHQHMHHGGGAGYGALAHASAHCVMTGQVCLSHCMELFAAKDTELAVCAQRVRELIATCTALQDIAYANSRFVPALARVVADVCRACEEECRKHAKKHETCKACADACIDCLKECKNIGV